MTTLAEALEAALEPHRPAILACLRSLAAGATVALVERSTNLDVRTPDIRLVWDRDKEEAKER